VVDTEIDANIDANIDADGCAAGGHVAIAVAVVVAIRRCFTSGEELLQLPFFLSPPTNANL